MKLNVVFVAGFMAATCCTPAMAADLGGDCCADLEERIAELEATTARKGNRKMSVQIYGQVTTALMYWDNGVQKDAYVVDGATESSRFGMQGSAKINPGLTAGFQLEVSAISAPSNTVTEIDDDGGQAADGAIALRLAYWYLKDAKLGTLSVGRLKMTTDGITEIDLGGTNVVAKAGLYFGNDIEVFNGAGVGVGNFDIFALGNFEFDRNNGVRYDTPVFGGFTAGAAWGEDDRWDAALRYAGEFGEFRIAAGIAYSVDQDEIAVGEHKIISGSLSVLHKPTGLFATGAGAERTREDLAGSPKETYWMAKGGITKNWFGIGNTVLYGEYHVWETAAENKAEVLGAGIVQNLDAAAMELFLAYKHNTVDLASGVATRDQDIVISGARIRF
jgi:predicted porin